MGWAIYYTIEKGQAAVVRCVGDASPLTLPAQIGGCPVTALGADCFAAGNSPQGPGLWSAAGRPLPPVLSGPGTLCRVTLPDTLVRIGERAFARCAGLKRLTLPPGLAVLGRRAFEGCGLEHLVLPESLTALPDYAFANCRSLTRLTLPEGLATVGGHAFYNCRALEELALPEGTVCTGESLLQNCAALARLTAPLGANLGVLLSDLQNPLTLTVPLPDGVARFFLPGFSYEYESITAPRVWRTITYGAGQLYRECFSSRDIDFDLYEAHFPTALLQDDVKDTVRIALCRLRWPYRLSARGREQYAAHIRSHWDTVLDLLLAKQDLAGLTSLLELVPPDPADLDRLTARAREANQVLFVSRLMEAGMGRKRRKTFDL